MPKHENDTCRNRRHHPAPTAGLTAIAAALVGALGLSSNPACAALLNIPTGAESRSQLFGAKPFRARVVLFEEFGLNEYTGVEDSGFNSDGQPESKTLGLPQPLPNLGVGECHGTPVGEDIDNIIKKKVLYPLPGEFAHVERDGNGFIYANPWQSLINDCLGVDQASRMAMPMDGRPGGDDFKHQRWAEFAPKKFFQTVMAGARISRGIRDGYQSHGYGKDLQIGQFSEFAPGGLYHNTVTSPYANSSNGKGPLALANAAGVLPEDANATYVKSFEGTTKGIPVNVSPLIGGWPDQETNSVWTFDGTIPAKLLMSRYGESILLRHHNALPILDDVSSNKGFGTHTISTHAHNVHNPAESDGFAGAWFYPGQFFDYHWPQVLAGHDTINTGANDPRAGLPCTPGSTVDTVDGSVCPASGVIQVPGDYRETQSTLWFHDHMEDFTAQNVYKGNAAMMNNYSAVDRGNETFNCRNAANPNGVNLCFPSGTARSWGNRDYDVNLVIADKAFDQLGQLWFNPLNKGGFLGDVMTVNWVYKPYMDVRARRYRFRLLNGSVSRYLKIAVVDEKGAQVPFHMIANDGNIMEHAIAFPNTQAGSGLPTQSIAERYDIIVDFAPLYAKGIKKVYLVNLMEHAIGDGPKAPVSLSMGFNAFNGDKKTGYNGADFAVGKFMELRIRPMPQGQIDRSMDPSKFVVGKGYLLPKPTFTQAELKAAKHRTFIFGKKPDALDDGTKPWTIATDGGEGLNADIARISAAPVRNSVEIWHLVNNSGGWSHPAHIHFEEGQIINKRNLADSANIPVPDWEKYARKDMYRVGPEVHSAARIDVAIRVRDFTGTYVEHCHNTQHEDNAMLLRWDSEDVNPADGLHMKAVRTPHPDWDGVHYVDDPLLPESTYKLPTADDGSTAFDTKLQSTVSTVSNFTLPANWGLRAADIPADADPK